MDAVWVAISLIVIYGLLFVTALAPDWVDEWRRRRRLRIERELDRTQAELRATLLDLASQLGSDAHEARRALIRESFLASGRIPPEP